MTVVQRGDSIDASPSVLVWARQSMGLELGEAADIAKVQLRELGDWETGSAPPTLADLTRLARAYHRPLAALLLSEPPVDEPEIADFRRHRGYRPPRMSPGLHLGLRYARRQQRIASELSVGRQVESPRGLRVGELPDPADLAARERATLAIPLGQQAQWPHEYAALAAWRRAVEDRGVIVLQIGLPPDEVRGFSLAGPGVSTIALAAGDAAAARTFTLLHEYCHLLVGRGGLCAPEALLRSSADSEEVERYCNRFAGILLVPSDALERHPGAQRIAAMRGLPENHDFAALRTTFKASNQVMWYRLHETGLVSSDRYEALWRRWSAGSSTTKAAAGGGGRHRAKRSLDTNGARFVGMVLEAEEQGEITYADALDYLSIQAKDWNELAGLIGGVR